MAITGILCIWVISSILNRIQWTVSQGEEIPVALVQAAIEQEIKWQPEQIQRTLELYLSLSEPYWGKKLIIWPETAVPVFYHEATAFIERLETLARQRQSVLLTGIPYMDPAGKNYYNSLMVIDSQREIYHKRHLVPFGEYLPFGRWLRPLLGFLRIPMSDFSAGVSPQPLVHAADIPVGVSICYEDVFGEEVIEALPEARLLLNISNDAWFGDSIAPHQHQQMARMRARETGRYMLRATNTGVSAIIDEKGKIISKAPQFKPHVIAGSVKLFSGSTPYARFGNLPVILFSLLILISCLIYQSKHSRQREVTGDMAC
jgi:apolipoprotein N-acyltransferase